MRFPCDWLKLLDFVPKLGSFIHKIVLCDKLLDLNSTTLQLFDKVSLFYLGFMLALVVANVAFSKPLQLSGLLCFYFVVFKVFCVKNVIVNNDRLLWLPFLKTHLLRLVIIHLIMLIRL